MFRDRVEDMLYLVEILALFMESKSNNRRCFLRILGMAIPVI